VRGTTQGQPVGQFLTQVFGRARVGKVINIAQAEQIVIN
jgi:hypothetical protein